MTLLSLAGVLLTGYGLFFVACAVSAKAWSVVDGQVLSAAVERRNSSNSRWISAEEKERAGCFMRTLSTGGI